MTLLLAIASAALIVPSIAQHDGTAAPHQPVAAASDIRSLHDSVEHEAVNAAWAPGAEQRIDSIYSALPSILLESAVQGVGGHVNLAICLARIGPRIAPRGSRTG
ncbi:hypothetical protein EAH79_01635 [Sphingomonas koreensis]|nr:hypothetical protein EAH79_01635 [Sphingomonas koreensis]